MDVFAKKRDRKKKKLAHADRTPHADPDGMSFATKRHFNNIKRKMFEFIDKKNQGPSNDMFLAPPSVHHRPPPSPMFADRNRAHFHTPALRHRNLPHHQGQLPLHKQLPHLGLATPQVLRRQ